MEAKLDEEGVELLKKQKVIRVATISSKGDPFLVTVPFHFDGNAVYFPVLEGTPEVANLRGNRRMAILADIQEDPLSESLMLHGLAQFVRGRGEHDAVLEAMGEKYPGHPWGSSGERLVKALPLRVFRLTREG